MARKEPMKIAKIKDATFTELASGTGTKITREQLISKILSPIIISLTEIPKGDLKSSKLKLIFLILTLAPGNSLIILLSISF